MFIWNIELGLIGLPNNRELSDRHINLTLAVLLFLTSARRCHEICYLNIKFMVGTLNFSLANLRNVGRKGNLELVWSFYEHSDDKKLCSGLY